MKKRGIFTRIFLRFGMVMTMFGRLRLFHKLRLFDFWQCVYCCGRVFACCVLVTILSEKSVAQDGSDRWVGSFMFTEQDMLKIEEAQKLFQQSLVEDEVATDGASAEDLAESPAQQAPEEVVVPFQKPAIYLNSVVYVSDDSWSIWINDQQVTHHTLAAPEGIDVASVLPDEVILIYSDNNLSQHYPLWSQLPALKDDMRYVSNYRDIVIDRATQRVSVLLGPHQSFVPTLMRVLEGKISEAQLAEYDPFDPGHGIRESITVYDQVRLDRLKAVLEK